MPLGDRTGPEGRGPMTGRQLGNCGGQTQNIAQPQPLGRGQVSGRVRAPGIGRRQWMNRSIMRNI